jgi:glucose-6-phosphate 1-dehydrogenase
MMDGVADTLSRDPAALGRADPAPPCTLVIFGAGGDLTKRLLMPALYNMTVAGLLPEAFSVLGVDRVGMDDGAFRDAQTKTMKEFVAKRGGKGDGDALDQNAWGWLRGRLHYAPGDFDNDATFKKISEVLAASKSEDGHGNAVFYLAVADRFFGPLVDKLAKAGLTKQAEKQFRRVVIEKPFGHDLDSAKALNAQILRDLDENQIYRIDHFLGKETVQNIMALRFSNGIFEPLWRREFIDHVQITAAETVGVESRAKFYEATGALRDMVPNHMFQLLAMVAMEAPNSPDADAVRAEKAKAVQAVRPLSPAMTVARVVRGQYHAGQINGQDVPGYREEPNVDPQSTTETYIAMKLGIENWRWAGVPFYIRTGKRMSVRKTEISVHFKQAPATLFKGVAAHRMAPNIMTLHIQPHEGVSLQFSAKIPGPVMNLGAVNMDFRYSDYFKEEGNIGYETLLYDVLIGDPSLFQRADNVEAGWQAVQPILDSFASGQGEVFSYAAGSDGPAEADALLARDGRHWAGLAT